MDPTVTLRRIRNIIDAYKIEAETPLSAARMERLAGFGEDLMDAFEDLDSWLSTGGFLPADWSKAPRDNPCPYTHAHTRHWCGHNTCRDS